MESNGWSQQLLGQQRQGQQRRDSWQNLGGNDGGSNDARGAAVKEQPKYRVVLVAEGQDGDDGEASDGPKQM